VVKLIVSKCEATATYKTSAVDKGSKGCLLCKTWLLNIVDAVCELKLHWFMYEV